MGKVKWNGVANNASTTTFRVWGKAVSDNLATLLGAGKLIKTTDTGQIVWTTVVKPATAGTMAGYEVYRFDDALQATKPVFLKVSYGNDAASVAYPAILIEVGDATNGAGGVTLFGGPSPVLSVAYGGSSQFSTTTAYASWLSVQPGFFGFAWQAGNDAVQALYGWLTIERVRDDAGALLGDGLMVMTKGSQILEVDFVNLITRAPSSAWPGWVPGNRISSRVGTEVQLFRNYMTFLGGPTRNLIGTAIHMAGEIAQGAEITGVSLMNSDPHDYVCFGAWGSGFSATGVVEHSLAMRYEV